MSDEAVKTFWAIEYANGQQCIGRFNGRWTLTHDLGAAMLWPTRAEAENARQALMQDVKDRLANSKNSWPSDMWWNLGGGWVGVREVERITRWKPDPPAGGADGGRE